MAIYRKKLRFDCYPIVCVCTHKTEHFQLYIQLLESVSHCYSFFYKEL